MDQPSNLATIEAVYRRWNDSKGRNVEEVLALFADDIEMRSVLSPDVPHEISGTHSSKDEARAYFDGLLKDWEMLSFETERFIADAAGDDIVMIGRCAWRNRQTGFEVDTPKVDIWRFENGRATLFYELFDSLAFARGVGLA
jgi:ketosteroid isomerase-like protein